jgi:hypothetical protein
LILGAAHTNFPLLIEKTPLGHAYPANDETQRRDSEVGTVENGECGA